MLASEVESSSERRFFEEREQVRGLLQKLVQTQLPTLQSDLDHEFLAAHATVSQILDRYLEQSHLLDPYLHEIVNPLVTEIKRVMTERTQRAKTDDAVAFPCQVYRNPRLHKLFQIIYQLCKVRGYKTVVKLLPHEYRRQFQWGNLASVQDRYTLQGLFQ